MGENIRLMIFKRVKIQIRYKSWEWKIEDLKWRVESPHSMFISQKKLLLPEIQIFAKLRFHKQSQRNCPARF